MTTEVQELIDYARKELHATGPWRVVTSQQKLTKVLFEYEDGGGRYVGKVSKTQDKVNTFDLMKCVWDAGMKSPSPYQIVEPVAWLPERLLLIQSRAEGASLLDLVKSRDSGAMAAMEQAGNWLHVMQKLNVELPRAQTLHAVLDRCDRELEEPRASAVLAPIRDMLDYDQVVPSHGDFHPLNLYSDGTHLTAIDLDTLAMREPAFDVAYFVSQLAVMGYHALGSFDATAALRKRFLDCAPAVSPDRVDLHVRFALLRSLHYDFCILRLKDRRHKDAFLQAAERGLLD